jgi:plastocyanin
MSTRTILIAAIAVALVAALVLTGCTGGSSGGTTATPPAGGGTSSGGTSGSTGTPGGTTITESGFAFDPSTLEVKVGDTVTFTNQDSAPHNVEIDGRKLGEQTQGTSVGWKAQKAGTFPFKCVIHPSMTGQITVK